MTPAFVYRQARSSVARSPHDIPRPAVSLQVNPVRRVPGTRVRVFGNVMRVSPLTTRAAPRPPPTKGLNGPSGRTPKQRVLNKKRIPTIARYIVDNEDGYLFSAITASYKCQVEFQPINGGEMGMLEMEFEDANFVINDGQHRCAVIAHAVKENPALGEESLSVLLFPYENRAGVQQMFSDLNRFVKKTSKSLDILYDKRDGVRTHLLTLQLGKGRIPFPSLSVQQGSCEAWHGLSP